MLACLSPFNVPSAVRVAAASFGGFVRRPVTSARLAGVSVFVAQSESDHLIPRELLARTWSYLLNDSGKQTYARRDPGAHNFTPDAVNKLSSWSTGRFQPISRAAQTRPGK